jgi:hypothetical protein
MTKSRESIRGALALATCSLLAPGTSQAAGTALNEWDFDSAVLFYSEQDRVDVVEPAFVARKDLGNDEFVTVRGVFDSMTGASPNGATITDEVQTFTGASGSKTYTVDANQLPTVEFTDARIGLGLDWDKPVSATSHRIAGINGSVESDYLSFGGSYTRLWDVNNKHTTWMSGVGGSLDIVSPTGGAPTALQRLSEVPSGGEGGDGEGEDEEEDEDGEGGEDDLFNGENKYVLDAVVGVTQVLSPRSLLQFNYTLSYRDGYLNDPYKLVSLIDAGGATTDYLYESRPDKRFANIFYLKWVYHLPEDVFRVSYRYFTDDWGVRSHTVDLSYRFELGSGFFLSPHGRQYTQTAADFYRHSLPAAEPLPEHVSADYRLAEMDGTTVGLKLGRAPDEDSEWSLLVERMAQTGDSHPADAVGIQNNFDLYPDLDAVIIQLNYFARF